MRGSAAASRHERRARFQVSRIEWLTGPRAGEVVEVDHDMHIWDWVSWTELLAATGFVQTAALDPNMSFEEIPLGEALYQHPVTWHLVTPT